MDPSQITKKANLFFSVTLDDLCFFAAIATKCYVPKYIVRTILFLVLLLLTALCSSSKII